MGFKKYGLNVLPVLVLLQLPVLAQKDYNGPPLFINVNSINLEMKKLNGEGQFTTQYSLDADWI